MARELPPTGTNNLWYHFDAANDTTLVYVHGVLSDSRRCWYREGQESGVAIYWPDLVLGDSRLQAVNIYLGGYYTAVDAGPYEVRNCADELFNALGRPDHQGQPAPLDLPRLVFVCHSTGGIVVRYLLEQYADQLADKDLGLLLIASPSYGSKLADHLGLITRAYRHHLGIQLQWGSWSLRDLDSRFRRLLESRRLPRLVGAEACENHFVVHRRWLPGSRRLVVTEESAGRYFGPATLLRQTDHFTCVKPDGPRHPAHELLVDFVSRHFTAPRASAVSGRPAVGRQRPPVGEHGLRPARSPNPDAGNQPDVAVPAEYDVLERLYRGHHSVVIKCRLRTSGELCVVKKTERALVSVESLAALQKLAHPNILTPRRVWLDDTFVWEELPFLSAITLMDGVAGKVGGVTGSALVSLEQQLTRTLRDLHGAGLIYRDVHADNIFIRVTDPATRGARPGQSGLPHDFTDVFGPRPHFSLNWLLADSTFVVLADRAGQVPPVVHGSATPEEQAQGRPEYASDLYALGATLLFALNGHEIPDAATRRLYPEPAHSFPDGGHTAGEAFADHLQALLDLEPDRRQLSDGPRPRGTVMVEYTGTFGIGGGRVVLASTSALNTELMTRAQAREWHRARLATTSDPGMAQHHTMWVERLSGARSAL